MAFGILKIFALQSRRQLKRAMSGSLGSMWLGDERTPLVEGGKISRTTRTAYALGHVFNDLAAAMWFSYTLLFLQRVALLEPLTAGWLMMLGQVTDALMTPVFGVLVDRYPQRKSWHVLGSVMVGLSFPILFGSFFTGEHSNSTIDMLVYVLCILVFQTGWAAVQISHLSMIPALANTALLRAELTAIRYSAQVSAAVIVFVVTWAVLPIGGVSGARLGPQDSYKFRNIAVVLTLFGLMSTILFHAFLNARLLEGGYRPSKLVLSSSSSGNNIDAVNNAEAGLNGSSSRRLDASPERRRRVKSWLDTSLLARVALLYVASRLFVTLATVYLPLYIEETGLGGRQALATVPMASYASSFVAAFFLKHINRSCGSKFCYLLGCLIGLLAAVLVEYDGSEGKSGSLYATAVLIGAASSITMVTALSITADLIGSRTESSALVYSIVTFLDKVVTGLVVLAIEKWRCLDKELCPHYNRDSLALVCASSMTLGLFTLCLVSRCISNP